MNEYMGGGDGGNGLPDQRQQQADEEQQLHEVLDAAYRIDQAILARAEWVSISEKQEADIYRTHRQDLETLALHGGYLNLLHKPLR